MTMPSHPKIYDTIGVGYRGQRVPDIRIMNMIRRALESAKTVCNLGAGAGSYEPVDLQVTAVEPSITMIRQRVNRFPVIQATAEDLPFAANSFDAAMAILTVHHWSDPEKGLREMRRVSTRQVVLTFDPDWIDSFWLVRDYLPEIIEFDRGRFLEMRAYQEILNVREIISVPIPWDCSDGFQAAYWRRPGAYLDAVVRSSISTFAQLPNGIVQRGIAHLKDDLESGAWEQRYADLLDKDEMDFGYRLVVAESA